MNIERLKREFIFETFEDAFNIHRKISQEIRQNGFITYSKLRYDLLKNDKRTYKKEYDFIGWKNLWYCKIDPNDNYEWVLKMPLPISFGKVAEPEIKIKERKK